MVSYLLHIPRSAHRGQDGEDCRTVRRDQKCRYDNAEQRTQWYCARVLAKSVSQGTCITAALMPIEIGPLAASQAAISSKRETGFSWRQTEQWQEILTIFILRDCDGTVDIHNCFATFKLTLHILSTVRIIRFSFQTTWHHQKLHLVDGKWKNGSTCTYPISWSVDML